MKLRIRGNSVRLRLSQSETVQLDETGTVADSIEFPPGGRLEYGIEVGDVPALEASYDQSGIKVTVPSDTASTWLEPQEVTISAEQSLGGGRVLTILIEKDFACLAPREGEEDSDAFPNPQAGND